MENLEIKTSKGLRGALRVPADKSISHRSVIISSLAEGKSAISNFLKSEDCLWTLKAYESLGVNICWEKDTLIIKGKGLRALKAPADKLYFGNSGTGVRLSAGVLAGCGFTARLTGDESLSSRPMRRITEPLMKMGAEISGRDNANFLPLTIRGGGLKAISYKSPIASAQVKSSILFAGLSAEGKTTVSEPYRSRDHTERMLAAYGADIEVNDLEIAIKPTAHLKARQISVPADISSAAFFMVAASIVPGSEIRLEDVGINPTRCGIIDVLNMMEADISILGKKENQLEPTADVIVKNSQLRAVTIEEGMLPRLIDELPVIMVAATQARGTTIIKRASELRVKETDRISSMVTNLKKLGASIEAEGDDVVIEGPAKLNGDQVRSFGDHRTAMSMAVAALIATGITVVQDTACVKTSFPGFKESLDRIQAG